LGVFRGREGIEKEAHSPERLVAGEAKFMALF
jgi:hypothetical protein